MTLEEAQALVKRVDEARENFIFAGNYLGITCSDHHARKKNEFDTICAQDHPELLMRYNVAKIVIEKANEPERWKHARAEVAQLLGDLVS